MATVFDKIFNKFIAKPMRLIGLFNYGYLEAVSDKEIIDIQKLLNTYIIDSLGFKPGTEIPRQDMPDSLINTEYTKEHKQDILVLHTSVFKIDGRTMVTILCANQNNGLTFGTHNYEVIRNIGEYFKNTMSGEVIYSYD